MITPTTSPSTIYSSGTVTAVSISVISNAQVAEETPTRTNTLEMDEVDFIENSSGSGLNVEVNEIGQWNAEKNGRFRKLAREEALGELSIEELAELEALTRLRRAVIYPRTADEILWQRRQQSLTRNLVRALQAYVEFHETTHSA
jgi:hypothetical protein